MKAMVLCGGLPQIELIKDLKARGIYTILLDMNDKVLGREYADKFYPVSVLDVDAVRKVAIDEKVDYIMTVCADQVLLVVAQLCEELGLPWYIDYETAKKVSDKSYMKEIFKKYNIPSTKYYVSNRFISNMDDELVYPLIVKPVDSYSSRGVKKISTKDQLEDAFNSALKISRTGTAIVEEYVQGKELTVDVYVEDGISHVLCVSQLDKIPGNDRFIINRCMSPADISVSEVSMIENACQKIVEALNLRNSPMLVQLITTGDKIYIIEFCARTGGGDKFRLIQKTTGFDVVKAVLDLTCGGHPKVYKLQRENKYVLDEFLYCNPSCFDHLEGFDDLLKNNVISEYYTLKTKGTMINEASCSGDRVAYFTIQADNFETLKEKHAYVNDTIKIIDINGNDVLRHDLLTTFK